MHNETDGIVGATTSVWCNELHKSAQNGDKIEGMWISQQWRWDGEVRNFQHDESWDHPNALPTLTLIQIWNGNSAGIDK